MKPLSQGRMDGSTSNSPLHAADSSLFHVQCLRAIKESDLYIPIKEFSLFASLLLHRFQVFKSQERLFSTNLICTVFSFIPCLL